MKRATIVMSAVLATCGFGLSAGAATPATSPASSVGMISNNIKQAANTLASDVQIRRTLADLTSDVMSGKDMSRLVAHFSPAQEQRLEKSSGFSQGFGDKLTASINDVSKTWKQKFGHDLSIKDTADAYGPTFASVQTTSTTATATIKGIGNRRDLTVPMVCQNGTDWKIDVPASLTLEKLRSNLQAELSEFNRASANWPASESDAYRLLTRCVAMAVLDKPLPMAAVMPATQPQAKSSITTPTKSTPMSNASSPHAWWKFWQWW